MGFTSTDLKVKVMQRKSPSPPKAVAKYQDHGILEVLKTKLLLRLLVFPSVPITDVANAAYMVIAPGKHTLTIDYHIEDPVTKVKGIITKTLAANDFKANMVYDISANLTPKDYSANYYMWNALEATWTEKSHLFIPYGPAISGQYPLIGTNR